MELKAKNRESGKKSELSRIRRDGDIPAVIYSKDGKAQSVSMDGALFRSNVRKIVPGCLATQKFTVQYGDEQFKAIVKDIQYERTTYNILHIDFLRVSDEDEVTVHVPVVCKGKDLCVGISQGGQLKLVKRSVKVSMKLRDMPEAFVVNVAPLALGESFRVKDIELAAGMKARIDGNQVLIAVSK